VLAAAAVVVVLGGVGIGAATRFGAHGAEPIGPPVGPGQTDSPTSPGPVPSPSSTPSTDGHSNGASPTDFPFPALPDSATHLGAWQTAPHESLPGKAYFLDASRDRPSSIAELGGGQLRTSSLGTLGDMSCIAETVVFSPDGTRVAWVRGALMSGGQLVLVDLVTGKHSQLADNVACPGGAGPKWRADSRSIVYGGGGANPPVRQISLVNGATTALPESWYGYRPMAGPFAAPAASTTSFQVLDANDKIVHQVTFDGFGTTIGLSVQGISDDGRYVALGHRNTDPGVVRLASVVVDTVSGEPISLPATTDDIVTVRFVAGGGMVVQTADRLLLTSADGSTVRASVPWTGGLLMTYVP
jgi:Tol biopolymer transport system component